ncbi:hypothetical protein DVH24_018354 [Malus domestica]|uniref:Disease resistance protein RPS4B/Roq1-like leucine-rich repeats domain-containing protein n=1 Tax=Malus domestica TaxID=3750 RepID=A0A498KL01_MALDO|nr:hypothetical protein DVH24_018354 [Malus domestica]
MKRRIALEGTKKIKGIVVKWPKPDVIPLNSKSFFKMVNLEIFISRNACFFGCIDYLPNDLRWIDLGGYKFQIWETNILQMHTVTFNLQYLPRHLVTFNMSYSDIRQLKGLKNLANLTYMNLCWCKFLEKIPDLSGIPNIEYLNLQGCTNLVEVDDSIGFLNKLVTLNLMGCSRLTRFAQRLILRSLKSLYLRGCTRLKSFPEIEDEMKSLTYLDIQESGIRELPSSIAYLTGLGTLYANNCENLIGTSLHDIYGLQHLSQVSFNQCPKLVTFGKNKMKFDEVSSNSTESQLLSNDIETSQDNCNTFALPNLQLLHLEGCNLSESNFLVPLDCWSTLTHLNLSRNNFVSLPDCISKFVNLETLNLSGCKRLRETPQALPPKLMALYVDDCTSLDKISKLPPELNFLHLSNCFRLCGHGVAKLENNLLNEGSLQRSKLCEVIYPGNEVPKWFNYTSNHHTTIQRLQAEYEWWGENFVGGSSFKIPLNLQVGETLFGLVLSIVFEARNFKFDDCYVTINGTEDSSHHVWCCTNLEAAHVAAHVGLKLVQLEKMQGDICNVEFIFCKGARIKSCGVHPLLRKEDEWLPLSLGPTSSLGKRPRPLGSSDTILGWSLGQNCSLLCNVFGELASLVEGLGTGKETSLEEFIISAPNVLTENQGNQIRLYGPEKGLSYIAKPATGQSFISHHGSALNQSIPLVDPLVTLFSSVHEKMSNRGSKGSMLYPNLGSILNAGEYHNKNAHWDIESQTDGEDHESEASGAYCDESLRSPLISCQTTSMGTPRSGGSALGYQ